MARKPGVFDREVAASAAAFCADKPCVLCLYVCVCGGGEGMEGTTAAAGGSMKEWVAVSYYSPPTHSMLRQLRQGGDTYIKWCHLLFLPCRSVNAAVTFFGGALACVHHIQVYTMVGILTCVPLCLCCWRWWVDCQLYFTTLKTPIYVTHWYLQARDNGHLACPLSLAQRNYGSERQLRRRSITQEG